MVSYPNGLLGYNIKIRRHELEKIGIPAEVFGSDRELRGDALSLQNVYSQHGAYHAVIRRALMDFGVSAYQLGQLLGCPNPNLIYRWLRLPPQHTKKSKKPKKINERRPSSRYMLRLTKLYQLAIDKVPLATISSIDWVTGVPTVPQSTNGKNGASGGNREPHSRPPIARRWDSEN